MEESIQLVNIGSNCWKVIQEKGGRTKEFLIIAEDPQYKILKQLEKYPQVGRDISPQEGLRLIGYANIPKTKRIAKKKVRAILEQKDES